MADVLGPEISAPDAMKGLLPAESTMAKVNALRNFWICFMGTSLWWGLVPVLGDMTREVREKFQKMLFYFH
jgi:hypothetical protein